MAALTYAGTVFELTPAGGGTWTEKVLYSFGNGTDGSNPYAGLIFDAAGNLYGTTNDGRRLRRRDSVRVDARSGRNLDGDRCCIASATARTGPIPSPALIFDAAGNLYGTTYGMAAAHSVGTVFELTPAAGGTWTEKVLHSFGNGTDGANPQAGADLRWRRQSLQHDLRRRHLQPRDGVRVDARRGRNLDGEVLHSFGNGTDGADPDAGLIFDAAGNLYGTTYQAAVMAGERYFD